MKNYRRDFSLFQLLDRKQFDQLVEKHQMDKGVRSLSTWEMTCALMSCMLLRLGSLAEVEMVLGIPHSTLGDALGNRFHGFFQDLCDAVLLQLRAKTQSRKIRRVIREVLAIDSTECRVHGSLFDLPGWKQKSTKGNQASTKLHTIYHVNGEWVDDFRISGVRRSDSPASFEFAMKPSKIYVFDKGYCSLLFWLKILDAKSHFVTRLRHSAKANQIVAEMLQKDPEKVGILYDEQYKPKAANQKENREKLEAIVLRHIIYRDPESKKILHLLTSDLKLSAKTIASLYKERWTVELLYRWLKGHLHIRYLPVKNSNAVKIQLSIAILIQLLLQLKKITSKTSRTIWEILRNFRITILVCGLDHHTVPDGCRWGSPLYKASRISVF